MFSSIYMTLLFLKTGLFSLSLLQLSLSFSPPALSLFLSSSSLSLSLLQRSLSLSLFLSSSSLSLLQLSLSLSLSPPALSLLLLHPSAYLSGLVTSPCLCFSTSPLLFLSISSAAAAASVIAAALPCPPPSIRHIRACSPDPPFNCQSQINALSLVFGTILPCRSVAVAFFSFFFVGCF
ncbi:unnamed protein product [Acanthosepion pharaonis]|uniref:Uncharacterized protein n=1 Tax=Acanthosepion pharaonis TaxID=158019 RepID=A0A812B592_ACAPH|nr:unnamed protein product [Sepia pharaonis]